ncbi:MAG: sigma-70 family RNA polymerase sigma factor [Chloroflexota bacterium]
MAIAPEHVEVTSRPGAIELLDQQRLGELLLEHYRAAYSLAMRLLGQEADALDAVQEAYLRAVQASRRPETAPRDLDAFGGWLLRIVTNVALGQLRRRPGWREVDLDRVADVLPTEDWSPSRAALRREARGDVLRALLSLPGAQRAALTLREYQGLSYQEIAESMETTASAVETLLVRARRGFRAAYEGLESVPTDGCVELTPLLSASLDNEVTPRDWRRLDTHLVGCTRCRRELGALRRGRRLHALWPLLTAPVAAAVAAVRGAETTALAMTAGAAVLGAPALGTSAGIVGGIGAKAAVALTVVGLGVATALLPVPDYEVSPVPPESMERREEVRLPSPTTGASEVGASATLVVVAPPTSGLGQAVSVAVTVERPAPSGALVPMDDVLSPSFAAEISGPTETTPSAMDGQPAASEGAVSAEPTTAPTPETGNAVAARQATAPAPLPPPPPPVRREVSVPRSGSEGRAAEGDSSGRSGSDDKSGSSGSSGSGSSGSSGSGSSGSDDKSGSSGSSGSGSSGSSGSGSSGSDDKSGSSGSSGSGSSGSSGSGSSGSDDKSGSSGSSGSGSSGQSDELKSGTSARGSHDGWQTEEGRGSAVPGTAAAQTAATATPAVREDTSSDSGGGKSAPAGATATPGGRNGTEAANQSGNGSGGGSSARAATPQTTKNVAPAQSKSSGSSGSGGSGGSGGGSSSQRSASGGGSSGSSGGKNGGSGGKH